MAKLTDKQVDAFLKRTYLKPKNVFVLNSKGKFIKKNKLRKLY